MITETLRAGERFGVPSGLSGGDRGSRTKAVTSETLVRFVGSARLSVARGTSIRAMLMTAIRVDRISRFERGTTDGAAHQRG